MSSIPAPLRHPSRTTMRGAPKASGEHRRTLFRRLDLGSCPSSGPFVGDDLLEAFDAVLGEGGHAIFTDAIDAQTAIFGKHVDREFVQPVLIFAKYLGDIGDGEDGGDGSQGQAA